jgi:hypothetical protein
MSPVRLSLAALTVAVTFATIPALAQTKAGPTKSVTSTPQTTTPLPAFLDSVPQAQRETLAQIVRKPTITTKYTEDPFVANETVYKWLLEHPDRVSLAWQRMKVECVEIKDEGKGSFSWSDADGSLVTWQPVVKFADGLVWHATGKVKAAAILPMMPVKAVAYVRYPSKPTDKPGIVTFTPETHLYAQTDSKAANLLLRIAGPAAPKMAEEGAEQLLFFFSGVATYLHKNPEQVATMLAPKKK